MIVNDGWFSATATEWENKANYTSGSYPAIMLTISKLRVNGTEYSFPNGGNDVVFGNTSRPEIGQQKYIDKFQGIMMPGDASMLKTILTVSPDIIGTPNAPGYDANGLADDPYKYITIQGIVTD